ncbi:MAG TPA: hypothetical protein VF746_08760 [Longimicrobium sp.]
MPAMLSASDVKDVLFAVWPAESDAVGPELIEMIAEGETNFEYDEGGSHLDFGAMIELLKLSVEMISIGLTVREIVQGLNAPRRNAFITMFEQFLQSEFERIPPEKRRALLDEAVRRAETGSLHDT